MADANNAAGNTVTCPKCQKEDTYLITVRTGKQYVCCKGCGNLMQAEVEDGQFTGKILG